MEAAERISSSDVSSYTGAKYGHRPWRTTVVAEQHRSGSSTGAKEGVTDSCQGVNKPYITESSSTTRRTDGTGDGPGSGGRNNTGKVDPSSVNRSSTLFTLFGLFAASSIATIWAYTKETIFGFSTEFLKHAFGGITALLITIGGAAAMADHSPKSTMAEMA